MFFGNWAPDLCRKIIKNVKDKKFEEAQKIQEKKVKDLRKSRDSKSLNEEMEKLRNACKDNVNLVPYLVSVAEKGGTVGEIVDVMKSVYGEWQESFGF